MFLYDECVAPGVRAPTLGLGRFREVPFCAVFVEGHCARFGMSRLTGAFGPSPGMARGRRSAPRRGFLSIVRHALAKSIHEVDDLRLFFRFRNDDLAPLDLRLD